MNTMNTLKFATDPVRLARAKSSFVLVGIVAPLLIGFAATLVVLLWLPELPDPVATHWSATGGPDGFSPAWSLPVMIAALTVGLTALLAGTILASTRGGRWGGTVRLMGAVTPAIVAFLGTALACTAYVQRGLANAAEVGSIDRAMLLGLGIAILVFAVAWFAQPRVDVSPEPRESVAAVALAPDARAVWMQTVTTQAAGMWLIALAVAVVSVCAVLSALNGSPATWILAAVAASLVFFSLTLLSFRVVVDASGLAVRGFIGWPVFRVPVDDVADVRIAEVSPMTDFGGWGVRLGGSGRFGIVVRTGEAIEVQRRSGKIFVVTVDDAARGAALLAGFADREQGAASH